MADLKWIGEFKSSRLLAGIALAPDQGIGWILKGSA
jgi:hypothetical protein